MRLTRSVPETAVVLVASLGWRRNDSIRQQITTGVVQEAMVWSLTRTRCVDDTNGASGIVHPGQVALGVEAHPLGGTTLVEKRKLCGKGFETTGIGIGIETETENGIATARHDRTLMSVDGIDIESMRLGLPRSFTAKIHTYLWRFNRTAYSCCSRQLASGHGGTHKCQVFVAIVILSRGDF